MTSASTSSENEAQSGATAVAPPQDRITLERTAALNSIAERDPQLSPEAAVLHGKPIPANEVTVLVTQGALVQIVEHSNSNLHCELGGVLLGHAFKYEERLYVDVQAAIPVVTNDSGPIHFTFTADAWAQIHVDRAAAYPQLDIVGWFHTHPDLSVFYSSDDAVVHTAAFTMPWHVGMVVDPVRNETCFFGWRQQTLVAFPGFYEQLDQQPQAILPWRVVRTAVWDHPFEYAPGQIERSAQSEVYLPPSGLPGVASVRPYLGLIIGTLGLLLSFFLLVGWVVPLTKEVQQLENTVIVLADKALADSNALTCPDPRLRILAPLTGQRVRLGSIVEIAGTAVYPNADRYLVQTRLADGSNWVDLGLTRRDLRLGELASWDTATYPQGLYEVSLQAVDKNNIALTESPPCAIQLELVP